MHTIDDPRVLKVILNENEKYHHTPLYEKIVWEAKNQGLAGATVYRGIMGYGKSAVIHTNKILELSLDLPVIIEIIDNASNINKFVPLLKELFDASKCRGIIYVQNTEITITPGI